MPSSAPNLPRGPVLDWSSFKRADAPGIDSVEQVAHTTFTTSGRAAIFHALRQLNLPEGSSVLVPTYHCPTMVAPVLLAGLTPAYFGIDADGLPMLDAIDPQTVGRSKAILVAHYFGLPRSLAKVRAWCDRHGIALIEDCAHCYFGNAGERPIGSWGDFATASLSKFFPVPEAGLLASAHRPIGKLALSKPGLKAQLKGWVDVFELAAKYRRFPGFNRALALIFGLKNVRAAAARGTTPHTAEAAVDSLSMMRDCDMARIRQQPLWASMWLKDVLPRGRVIVQRQANFAVYARLFADVQGAHPLFQFPAQPTAPYVFPLWVDDADRVYHALKARALPVFRWDRIWPGTPAHPDDAGPRWSQQVLQLLCHQDLSEVDITRIASVTLQLIADPTLTVATEPAPVST